MPAEDISMSSKVRIACVLAIPIILTMGGCASIGLGSIFGTEPQTAPAVDERGKRVAEAALSLVGARSLVVDGKTFPYDCTGVARAAYWITGVDLAQDFDKYTGNGVTRIYRTLESRNLLHTAAVPAPGDLIFWDNTYDRNKDGKWNDPLTHVAVVVGAYDDGRIEYVHENYRKGIVVEHMNLRDPDTRTKAQAGRTIIVNSPMRMRGQVTTPLWLSSHLFREFGRAYELR